MPTDQLSAYTADAVTDRRSIDYMRYLSCLVANKGAPELAARQFAARWPMAPNRDLVIKAAVTAGTTTDGSWGGPISPIEPLMSAFLAYSRPLTILGRLQGVRRVPFNVSVPMMTAPTSAAWVGEGLAKPISKGSLATVILGMAKVADTVIETSELVKLLVPDAAIVLRDDLAQSIAAFVDQQFVDPAVVGVAGVSPASITAGITPMAPSGTTSAALVKDVGTLIATFSTSNPGTTNAVILMMPATASQLVSATDSKTLEANTGGMYAGYPVLVSGAVGSRIVMLDASAILVADGGVTIDVSHEATVQMDAAPDSPPTGSTVEISLWQWGLVALRAERILNWKRARVSAVQLISPIAYVP